MDLKLRIKMIEPFKDGNILGGRFLRAGEFVIVSERDATLIENSGGLFEVIEKVIKNPLKQEVQPEVQPEVQQEVSSYREVAPATDAPKEGQTVRRRGRPRKGSA